LSITGTTALGNVTGAPPIGSFSAATVME
jgi:hypothetical protein